MRRDMPVIRLEDDDGNEIELPTKYEVCPRCEGRGSHVNPAIDGISMDEWWGPDWDDDSREAYLTGRYDIPCEECKGLRVVPVLDESRCTPEQIRAYEEHERTLAEIRAEARYWARMENGGHD